MIKHSASSGHLIAVSGFPEVLREQDSHRGHRSLTVVPKPQSRKSQDVRVVVSHRESQWPQTWAALGLWTHQINLGIRQWNRLTLGTVPKTIPSPLSTHVPWEAVYC